jgi:hypothetical protein
VSDVFIELAICHKEEGSKEDEAAFPRANDDDQKAREAKKC